MKQQYVLLREENDLLNSLIGQSFNQRTKLEANKILTEIHSKAQDRSIGKMTLCYVHDKGEIKGVGGSTLLKDKNGKIISNLILDNFGIILTAFFRGAPSGIVTAVIKDVTGVNRTLNVYIITADNFNNSQTAGGSIQVGSGSTPPARTDFAINTPFGTAPENGFVTISATPTWNSGLGNFKALMSITAGGSGTINETVLNLAGKTSGVVRGFVRFRDIISPPQSFIVGQTIAVEYTIQL